MVREKLSEHPYLLMLTNLCYGYWNNNMESMNMRVDKNNGKYVGMVKLWDRKVLRFSRNEFRRNIGCLVSVPTFGIGGSRICDKDEAQKISGNKSKRR